MSVSESLLLFSVTAIHIFLAKLVKCKVECYRGMQARGRDSFVADKLNELLHGSVLRCQ